MNSWCKVVNGSVVDGPRAWENNIPPDASWLPHRLHDPVHTINDNYDGSVLQVSGSEVVEVKQYSAKSSAQIADEIQSIKDTATSEMSRADSIIADPDATDKDLWQVYKDQWAEFLDVTALSWDFNFPRPPSNTY